MNRLESLSHRLVVLRPNSLESLFHLMPAFGGTGFQPVPEQVTNLFHPARALLRPGKDDP